MLASILAMLEACLDYCWDHGIGESSFSPTLASYDLESGPRPACPDLQSERLLCVVLLRSLRAVEDKADRQRVTEPDLEGNKTSPGIAQISLSKTARGRQLLK